MEKNSKKQIISPKKNNVIKYRNSVNVNSLSNHHFAYLVNHNNKLENNLYLDKSSSNSSSNSSSSNISNNSQKKQNSIKFIPVSDPISELSKANNVIIKIEYPNICCSNQTNNLYNVFIKTKTNIKYLFRAEEQMACIDYSLCEFLEKPFYLKIGHVESIDILLNTNEFATANRNCINPFLCLCCNHELKIRFSTNNAYCGKIDVPFSFGNTKYKIYDSKNKIKYIIDTEYCQSGILCSKNCCGYLPKVIFDIYNNKNENVGTIERKPGGYEEFMHVLDCYQIFFPKGASFENKFLLICAVFMIEREIFKDKWGSLEYVCCSCNFSDCKCNCDCNCECKCEDDCCEKCLSQCCAEFCASLFRC